jgi:hypothetical protein
MVIKARPSTSAQLRATFFDENNPSSLINKVWKPLVPVVRNVALVYSELLLSEEARILAFCKPDERDQRLRLTFWDEYGLACAQKRLMRYQAVMWGNIGPEVWDQVYMKDRKKILFMITQPSSYSSSMRRILDIGVKRLHEIMELPILLKNGSPDNKAIAQILKAFQLVDSRVKGSVVQRMQVDQRTLNINADASPKQAAQLTAETLGMMSMDELKEMEGKLQSLQSKREELRKALPPSEVEMAENVNFDPNDDDYAPDYGEDEGTIDVEKTETGSGISDEGGYEGGDGGSQEGETPDTSSPGLY